MVVLVICKYEEDLIKNEGARVLTRLNVVFSDAQGQLTPKSRWLSGRASASGSGGRGFEPRPRHTKGVKNGTNGYLAWCSAL